MANLDPLFFRTKSPCFHLPYTPRTYIIQIGHQLRLCFNDKNLVKTNFKIYIVITSLLPGHFDPDSRSCDNRMHSSSDVDTCCPHVCYARQKLALSLKLNAKQRNCEISTLYWYSLCIKRTGNQTRVY